MKEIPNEKKQRLVVCVNVHLLLEKEGKVLLSLRQNTGFEDNRYGLVAGHLESGESPIQAIIRETKEEIGVKVNPQDLKVVHTMHRRTNRENIDIFMKCMSWEGEVKNCEPDKCGQIAFYPVNFLPENTIPYIKFSLEQIALGHGYSEY